MMLLHLAMHAKKNLPIAALTAVWWLQIKHAKIYHLQIYVDILD